MSKPNGILASFIFLLVFSPMFSPKFVVLGSPVQEPNFKRPDPSRHFKNYNGGYNVTNKHYWTSAAFTGVHGYAIAGVWMLCGLGFGIFLTLKNLSSGSSPISTDHLDRYYFLMFLLVILFTILAIVASSFVLAENQSSLNRTKKLKNTIVKAGNDAHQTIREVINGLTKIQYLLLPYDPMTTLRLNVTTHRLGRESRIIQSFVQKNGHSINLAMQTSYISHIVVVTVNLVLVVAALVLLLLHWHPGFFTIIFLCWILTTLCWVLTGFDFFFHNFANDTCSAFGNFEENPQNNSLSSVLPCMDSSYSEKILTDIGFTIQNFISELNSKIAEVLGLLGLDEQNEASLGFGMICDPFTGAPNYSYVPENCPKNAIPIGDLPNVLSRFTCYEENSPETCRSNGKFISEASYNKASAYSRSVQDMLNIFPHLQSLAQCTIVKDTLSDVVLHQCRPFRVSIRLLWASMLSLSIFMVVLVVTWVAKAYQERGRGFSRCSIIPQPQIIDCNINSR